VTYAHSCTLEKIQNEEEPNFEKSMKQKQNFRVVLLGSWLEGKVYGRKKVHSHLVKKKKRKTTTRKNVESEDQED
jgi:hypothetical protein